MWPDYNEIKWSLTELTTRSDCGQSLSVVLLYLHMHQIPYALGCRAYLSMWEEGAFCVECFQVLRVIGAVSLLELAANSGSSRMTWLLI